jgi:hypothetical protein
LSAAALAAPVLGVGFLERLVVAPPLRVAHALVALPALAAGLLVEALPLALAQRS